MHTRGTIVAKTPEWAMEYVEMLRLNDDMKDLVLKNLEIDTQASWMRHDYLRVRKEMDTRPARKMLKNNLSNRIESDLKHKFGDNLWLGMNTDMNSFRFDFWFETDIELEQVKISEFGEKIIRVCKTAVEELATGECKVIFHSRQFVKERCNGNYFTYLR